MIDRNKLSLAFYLIILGIMLYFERTQEALFFSGGFFWNYFQDHAQLKLISERKNYRFSFLRFYFWSHRIMTSIPKFSRLPILPKLLPAFSFCLLIVLIFQSPVPFYFCLLGSLLFEIFDFIFSEKVTSL